MQPTLPSELHRLKIFTSLICGLVLFLIGTQVGVQAQTVQADRAQLTQSQTQTPLVPSISPQGTTEEQGLPGPNDADLGEQEVLKRVERYEAWTASIASPVFYTTNVALTDRDEKHDVISAPVAAVYYQPRIINTLYGFADVRQQFFYYNHYNDFDFGSLDVEAGLIYYLPQFHNLVLRGEYDFNRLTFSDRVLDEFFTNHALIFNAEIPFRFGRAQQLSLGADANVSVAADHQAPRRNDYEAYAGYSLYVTRALLVSAVGRVVVRDYHQNDRTDVSEILSLTASYQLTNWWSVSAIATLTRSDSNHDVFDYSVADVGGAIALTAKF
jgi:Putative beta-barrel porin 2